MRKDDELDIPKFTRDPRKVQSERGTLYINENATKRVLQRPKNVRINKFKLVRNTLGVIAVGVLVVFLLMTGVKKVQDRFAPFVPEPLPQEYVMIYVDDSIGFGGDSIYNNALEYWDADLYGHLYKDINHYVQAIADESNIRYPNRVDPGQKLKVPVIISLESEAYASYQRIQGLEEEIATILSENKWVTYVVKPGDSLLGIAAKAAGSRNGWIDTNMQYAIKDEITARNKMGSSTFLRDGNTIEIVNPELGPLRTERNDLIDQLDDLAKVNQTNDGPVR